MLLVNAPLRLVIGYFSGRVIGWFGMRFLGYFVVEKETTLLQERMLERTKYWNAEFAIVFAIVAVFVGGIKISTLWLWFVLVFGITCILPIMPFKSGSLLPFGTPYINDGPVFEKAVMLLVHASLAYAIAWCIHTWKNPDPRNRIIEDSTSSPLPDETKLAE